MVLTKLVLVVFAMFFSVGENASVLRVSLPSFLLISLPYAFNCSSYVYKMYLIKYGTGPIFYSLGYYCACAKTILKRNIQP